MKRRYSPIEFDLPLDLYEKFEKLCMQEGVSIEAYIDDLIAYEIAKKRALRQAEENKS